MHTTPHIQAILDFQKEYPHDKYHIYVLSKLAGDKRALESLSSILKTCIMCGDSKINSEIGAIAIPIQKFGRKLYTDESSEARPNSFKVYSSIDTVQSDKVGHIINGFMAGFKAAAKDNS